MTEKYIKVCPKCGSSEVGPDFSNPAVWAYGSNPQYSCDSCQHVGLVFPEVVEKDVKEVSKKFKSDDKSPKVDTYSGYFAGRLELLILFGVLSFAVLGSGFYWVESPNSYLLIILGLIGVVIFGVTYRKFKK